MNRATVRIESISISNFKNTTYGELFFSGAKKDYAASILGLYGQNGSGKTALIDAIALLKYALCSAPIPAQYADYVSVDADYAHIAFECSVKDSESNASYRAKYEFSLKKSVDDVELSTDESLNGEYNYKAILFDEVLSYSYNSDNQKTQMQTVIDTRTEEAFVPKTKYDILTAKNKSVSTDLLVAKKMALATSKSFIFSRELMEVVRDNCQELYHVYLLNALVNYGKLCLFVIDTKNSGLISLNAQPLSFRYEKNDSGAAGQITIPLDRAAAISKEAYELASNVVKNMNIVLTQLVPGLTISIENLGDQLLKSGKAGVRIQLMSNKNSKQIPLRYESEGIKKIVAVLQLLIVVYNDSSITVAIDELDSGVFEYLLGELLRIISEKGKGQLIFTSHNLRPLETLDKCFVAFTTTNSSNRYVRLVNIKTNNNLRDFYYRDIMLGEQNESVYETTNNSEIALAFREAGVISGS